VLQATQCVGQKESRAEVMRQAVSALEEQAKELAGRKGDKVYRTDLEVVADTYRAFYAHTISSVAACPREELIARVDGLRLLAFPSMKQRGRQLMSEQR